MRLTESHYSVKSYGDNNMRLDDFKLLTRYTEAENYCLPARIHETKHAHSVEEIQRFSGRESTLSGCSIYVDPGISSELCTKVKLCVLTINTQTFYKFTCASFLHDMESVIGESVSASFLSWCMIQVLLSVTFIC